MLKKHASFLGKQQLLCLPLQPVVKNGYFFKHHGMAWFCLGADKHKNKKQ